MLHMHNDCVFAPGNKIYQNERCFWSFSDNVFDILHRFSILDIVWDIPEIYSDGYFRHNHIIIQFGCIIHDS
jgi:hypothetical protein